MANNSDRLIRRSEMPIGAKRVEPDRNFVQLFIVAGSVNSRAAEANLRSFLAAHPEVIADVEVVDVREQPEAAVSAGVFVTPTLIRKIGDKSMIAVGNLHDPGALFEVFSG